MPLRRISLVLPCLLGATLVASLLPAPIAAAATAPTTTAAAAAPAAAPAPAPTTPAIIVTEILANTPGDDHFEYFEIHNTTAEAIDLAAQGFSFAYSYVDSDDLTRDVPLTVEEPVVVEAGDACSANRMLMPNCDPSPSSRSKCAASYGVVITRMSLMPASISVDSG